MSAPAFLALKNSMYEAGLFDLLTREAHLGIAFGAQRIACN
jgi:hypothetical protein